MKLQGGINFRDLGGHLGADNKRVKYHRLYRSGSLSSLTAEDCSKLESLLVRDIHDYRDVPESNKDRDVLWRGVNYECCPANPESHAVKNPSHDFYADETLRAIPPDFMETLYQKLPFSSYAYKRLFERLLSLEEGGLVQHCAVGKDRTGVGSALLLLALGVNKADVVEDYLRTEHTLKPFREKILEKVESNLSTIGLERLHYVMSVREHFLESAFNEIQKRYGNIERYFACEFSLTPECLVRLKTKFLE